METTGTLFYGKHSPRKDILETLAMFAESISRVKGFKEDTIMGRLREATEHVKAVEAVLMQFRWLKLDGLWAVTRVKKGSPRKRYSGAVRY